jgi:hypothetical protein
MRLLALSAATAIATTVSFGVSAADIAYPPAVVVQPRYGVTPGPAVAPPQIIIVPGPTATPQYNYGASAVPPVIGPPPYDVAPPVAPRVDVAPSAACPPIWRCGDRGCGWQQAGCVPHPEHYSGAYGSPAPRVYSGPDPSTALGPYSGPNTPQVDPGATAPYSGDRSFYRP